MKCVRRGLALATAVAVVLATAESSSTAGITPNPYGTTAATGTLTYTSPLGLGICRLSSVGVGLAGLSTGAAGSVTGWTSGCASNGLLQASALLSADITISRGTVTVPIALLVTTIWGGQCLYQGTLRGTATRPASSVGVSGLLSLQMSLAGVCEHTAGGDLALSFPGASITW